MSAKKSPIEDKVTIQLIKDLYMFFCEESDIKNYSVEALYYYFVKYKDFQIKEWVGKWDCYKGSKKNIDNKSKMRKIQRAVKLFCEDKFLQWLYNKKSTRQTFLQLVLHTYPDPALFYVQYRKGKEKNIEYTNWTAKRLKDHYSQNRLVIPLAEDKYFSAYLEYDEKDYQKAIDEYIKNSVHKMSGNQLSELTIQRPSERKGGIKSTNGEFLFKYHPVIGRGKKHKNIITLPDFFSAYNTYFYKKGKFPWYSVSGLAWVKLVINDPYIKDKDCKKTYNSMTKRIARYENPVNDREKTWTDKDHVYILIKGHVLRLTNTVINAYIARKFKENNF